LSQAHQWYWDRRGVGQGSTEPWRSIHYQVQTQIWTQSFPSYQ